LIFIKILLTYYVLVVNYEYIELWTIQVSPRATIQISRMVVPSKEKDFFLNEKYLKNLESEEENKKESKIRIEYKRNEEKYYLNAVIDGYDKNKFRTKGFSIFRHQIPQLIEALQNIHDGQFDNYIQEILRKSGLVKNTINTTQSESINRNDEQKKTQFASWVANMADEVKKEIKKLQDSGWSEHEIRFAFDSKHSGN